MAIRTSGTYLIVVCVYHDYLLLRSWCRPSPFYAVVAQESYKAYINDKKQVSKQVIVNLNKTSKLLAS